MPEVSILRVKVNYTDLQTFALLFLEINTLSPFLLICALHFIRIVIFWVISMFNGNKYWKFIYLLNNYVFRKRYWGLVINDKTFKPVSYVKVKLIRFEKNKESVSKKVLASTLSDFNGRYNFNYKGPYQNLFIEVHGIGYKNFYKEIDTLDHLSRNSEMVYDIYLTPSKKALTLQMPIIIINKITNLLIFTAAAIGLVVSIYSQLTYGLFTDFVLSAIYIFILYYSLSHLFRRYTLKKLEVIESLLMQKIPGAVVRLYDRKHQLHLAVTNSKGYVLLDWIPGEHQILVTKKGYELIDDNTGVTNSKAYLTNNKHIKLKKRFKSSQSLSTTHKDIKIRTSLQNPFAKQN